MAMQQSPVRCVSCRQPVPESTHLDYFGQILCKPEADDAENFLYEIRDITGYLDALFTLLANADASVLDDELLARCHHLGWALAREIRQRIEIANEALGLRTKCHAERPAQSKQASTGKGE